MWLRLQWLLVVTIIPPSYYRHNVFYMRHRCYNERYILCVFLRWFLYVFFFWKIFDNVLCNENYGKTRKKIYAQLRKKSLKTTIVSFNFFFYTYVTEKAYYILPIKDSNNNENRIKFLGQFADNIIYILILL